MRNENSVLKQFKKLKVTSFKKKKVSPGLLCLCWLSYLGKGDGRKCFKNDLHILVLPTKCRLTEAHFKEISRL